MQTSTVLIHMEMKLTKILITSWVDHRLNSQAGYTHYGIHTITIHSYINIWLHIKKHRSAKQITAAVFFEGVKPHQTMDQLQNS